MKTKQEVLREHLPGWLTTKPYSKIRRRLKEQLARSVKLHPRSVGRAMRRLQLKDKRVPERRGRPTMYTKDDNRRRCLVLLKGLIIDGHTLILF